MRIFRFKSAIYFRRRAQRHGTLLLTLVLLSAVGANESGPSNPPEFLPRFDPPPRLAITAQELDALKASPDFEHLKSDIVAAADKLIANPVTLPDGPGSWIFYYANPENGNSLEPLSLTEHKDSATGKVFSDKRTVAAY